MNPRSHLEFRLGLAEGFLSEAEQDWSLKRWRPCVDNAQVTVENAAKAIIALFGIPSKTHEPGTVISKLIYTGQIRENVTEKLKEILPDILALGEDEHFMTNYGDEAMMILPWDLYKESDAHLALTTARKIFNLARDLQSSIEH